jgi:hypothetical protein
LAENKKTTAFIDFKDLYDVVWKVKHEQEKIERRDIGFGPYIVEYIVRPWLKEKEVKKDD